MPNTYVHYRAYDFQLFLVSWLEWNTKKPSQMTNDPIAVIMYLANQNQMQLTIFNIGSLISGPANAGLWAPVYYL